MTQTTSFGMRTRRGSRRDRHIGPTLAKPLDQLCDGARSAREVGVDVCHDRRVGAGSGRPQRQSPAWSIDTERPNLWMSSLDSSSDRPRCIGAAAVDDRHPPREGERCGGAEKAINAVLDDRGFVVCRQHDVHVWLSRRGHRGALVSARSAIASTIVSAMRRDAHSLW